MTIPKDNIMSDTTKDAVPLSDAEIKACALMIKGICMTRPQEEWSSNIESRIRFMLSRSPAQVQAEAVLVDAGVEQFLSEVRAELMRARSKFPGDRIMTIALAEEFGELCKAVLDESAANVRKEAVQTAVMCARVVLDGDGSVIAWRAERGLDALVSTAPSTGDQS